MNTNQLPHFFKQLFWSCDYRTLDLDRDKKNIIVNTINYGDLNHWKWIKTFYGEEAIRNIIMNISQSEIRIHVQPLVKIIFSIPSFKYETRSQMILQKKN